MRIHTDKLTHGDFGDALRASGIHARGVFIEHQTAHGSRSRERAFEVRLAAATYDEHGAWFAELLKRDPSAIIGYYRGAEDFHRQTQHRYGN